MADEIAADELRFSPSPRRRRRAEATLEVGFGLAMGLLGTVVAIGFLTVPGQPRGPAATVCGAAVAAIVLSAAWFVTALMIREASAHAGWSGALRGFALTIRRGRRVDRFDLQTIDRLRWPTRTGDVLVVHGPAGRVRFSLGALDPATRLTLIRRLRTTTPTAFQHGWPAYCRASALPLIRCELLTRPLRPGERVETEPFSFGFALTSVLVGEIGGWIGWWLTGRAGWLAAGPTIGLFVAGMRRASTVRRRPRILPPPNEPQEVRDRLAAAEWDTLHAQACSE